MRCCCRCCCSTTLKHNFTQHAFLLFNDLLSQPGGMREAIRRRTRDCVLHQELGIPSALVLVSPAILASLYPPIILHIPPGRAQNTSSSVHFRLQKCIRNFIDFWIPFWFPTWSQKPPKIHPKSIKKSIKNSIVFLIDLLMDFWTKTHPKTYQKSIKNPMIVSSFFDTFLDRIRDGFSASRTLIFASSHTCRAMFHIFTII